MTTRIALPVSFLLASLVLTACSSGADGGAAKPTAGVTGATAATDTSLADVQGAGELVVGTEGTYRPFSYHVDGSGDLTGYDVEVARAVAEELGVEIRFEETQWDAIFAGLEAGRFDVIANQVSITPEREESYTFSQPYTYSTGVIVVAEGTTDIASFEDLEGKTTAQSLTSNWHTLAQESGAHIEAIEGWAQAATLVEQGRVDATINDKLTFLDYQKQTGDTGLAIAAETADFSRSAFALASGSDSLARAVDDALAVLAEDGTLAEISAEFFGDDVSVAPGQ
jgi:cystine transport system substrate-binding protein